MKSERRQKVKNYSTRLSNSRRTSSGDFDNACAGDEDLRREVEKPLASFERWN